MGTFRNKLFHCLVLVSVCSVALPLLYLRNSMQNEIIAEAGRQAAGEARILAAFLQGTMAREGWEDRIMDALDKSNARLTVMDGKGDVLLDSSLHRESGRKLDNHLDRPEVRMALQSRSGEGFAVRLSGTQGIKLIYAAVLMQNGGIVRIGRPFADLDQYFYARYHKLLFMAGAGLLVLLGLSYFLASRLRASLDVMLEDIGAIASGNYRRMVRKVPGREFLPMARGIQGMAASIEEQMAALRDERGQLETILDTLADGVLVLGPGGHVRRSNHALRRAFPALERGEGKVVAEVVPMPDLQERVSALMAEEGDAADHGGPPPGVTVNMENQGRFWSVRMSRVRVESPGAAGGRGSLGAVLVFTDVTDLLRLERTRRDFVANVSHELRTPLTAMQGYAETLGALEPSEEDYAANVRRFAGIIEKNSARLSRLVDDLLTLSRLENDPLPPPAAAADVAAVARETGLMFEAAFRRKNLELDLRVDAGLRAAVSADHLSLVLGNLLDNAARHSPEGGTIVLAGIREEGGGVLITVRDQGPGMPEGELTRIFERFYRLEKHRARPAGAERENHGLGLAICRHIVERNGGAIWASSPPAEFFVRLKAACV